MKGTVVKQGDVGEDTRRSMYALFSTQFEQVSYEQFIRDLEEKNWVLLLRRDDDSLGGFSCMHFYDVAIDGKPLTVVYSGDTVVSTDTWGDSALSYYWMGAIDYLRRLHKKESVYWFLLVSGYRTYRFLPVYSDYYFPRYDRPTPVEVQSIMHAVARDRFGDRYNPDTGIVQLDAPPVLQKEYRGIPENRLADPHIAFFAERNPGHEQGDELVCFAIVSEDRLTRLGRRMWARGRKLYPEIVES
ncbi:MAG: hypothetical protein WBM64_01985 [Woeseiaceae bacterium]